MKKGIEIRERIERLYENYDGLAERYKESGREDTERECKIMADTVLTVLNEIAELL